MRNWRPKRGWVNPYPDLTEEALTEKYLVLAMEDPKSNYEIFEAGADAMYEPAYAKGKEDGKAELLEALKAKGHRTYANVPLETFGEPNIKSNGWLILIPDEEGDAT